MHPRAFSPGFRLSSLDVFVLVVGVVAAMVLGSIIWWWGFVIGFVVGHFFLFCNLFRMARALELAWAVVFVALASGTIAYDTPSWFVTIAISIAATVVVIVIEMRKPSYHGIGWRRINPNLPIWWEAHGPATRGAASHTG